MKHKHHIIPRHMGGSDHPENLVEVSVEKHAELHYQLWKDLGQWQDFVAWKTLSGQIGKQEASRLAVSMANRGNKYSVGRIHSKATREKQRLAKIGKPLSPKHKEKIVKTLIGRPVSTSTRKKISEKVSGSKNGMYGKRGNLNPASRPEVREKISSKCKGRVFTEEHKQKLREARKRYNDSLQKGSI